MTRSAVVRSVRTRLRRHVMTAAGLPRYSGRALAVIAFLLACAGLVFVSLLIPDYVRAGWLTAFVLLGVGCLGLAVPVLCYGRVSSAQASVVVAYGDVAVVVAVYSLVDRRGGQVVGALLILSTMFTAIFLRPRYSGGQICIVTGCSWVIAGLSTEEIAVQLIRTAIFIVSVTCPAVFLLLVRQQLDRALQQAHDLATTDPLTGILNRRGLDERTAALLARSARAGWPVGVLIIDVDHFKQINDTRGHAVGDTVLELIAATIQAHIRADDLFARLGGEEMVVVTVAEAASLAGLGDRLRRQVQVAAQAWSVTVSIGVAHGNAEHPQDEDLLPRLLDAADKFMYQAKTGGRNRVCSQPADSGDRRLIPRPRPGTDARTRLIRRPP